MCAVTHPHDAHSLSEGTNLHAHSSQFYNPTIMLQFISGARGQDTFGAMNVLLTDDYLRKFSVDLARMHSTFTLIKLHSINQ
jgi:hypothetical protein